MDLTKALADARHAALLAWGRIAHFYRGEFEIRQKVEGPVTEADHLADQVILDYLSNRYPAGRFGFLTEETENDPTRMEKEYLWIIDPIDGTSDFVGGREDFAIHIALAGRPSPGSPILPLVGVVYHPLGSNLYTAIRGEGAFMETEEFPASGGRHWWLKIPEKERTPDKARFQAPVPLRVSETDELSEAVLVCSRSHPTRRLKATLAALRERGKIQRFYRRGSLGVKLMEVALRRADFYLVTEHNKVNEWDTAAPELILTEAGGQATDLKGNPVYYNQKDPRIEFGFLASNGKLHDRVIEELKRIDILWKPLPPK